MSLTQSVPIPKNVTCHVEKNIWRILSYLVFHKHFKNSIRAKIRYKRSWALKRSFHISHGNIKKQASGESLEPKGKHLIGLYTQLPCSIRESGDLVNWPEFISPTPENFNFNLGKWEDGKVIAILCIWMLPTLQCTVNVPLLHTNTHTQNHHEKFCLLNRANFWHHTGIHL